MFNLEPSIAEWRKRMLAAGIKTPVPLEELESHLREEIERRKKSGLSEADAFKIAVEEIGPVRVLQGEFCKAEAEHGVMRPVLLIMGWLAAGYVYFRAQFSLDFHWNLFNFHPRWDPETAENIVEILAMVIGF